VLRCPHSRSATVIVQVISLPHGNLKGGHVHGVEFDLLVVLVLSSCPVQRGYGMQQQQQQQRHCGAHQESATSQHLHRGRMRSSLEQVTIMDDQHRPHYEQTTPRACHTTEPNSANTLVHPHRVPNSTRTLHHIVYNKSFNRREWWP